MFQHQARTTPITLHQLLAAAGTASPRVGRAGGRAAIDSNRACTLCCWAALQPRMPLLLRSSVTKTLQDCTDGLPVLRAVHALPQGPSGDAEVLLNATSTASMSLVVSEGTMLTDGGGSAGLAEVEMG